MRKDIRNNPFASIHKTQGTEWKDLWLSILLKINSSCERFFCCCIWETSFIDEMEIYSKKKGWEELLIVSALFFSRPLYDEWILEQEFHSRSFSNFMSFIKLNRFALIFFYYDFFFILVTIVELSSSFLMKTRDYGA